MSNWKEEMVARKTISTKNKIINFLVFLAIWLVIYYLIKFNFGVIALILSYMLVYFRTDKQIIDGIIFLANEFDRHHDNLVDELNYTRKEHYGFMEGEKEIYETISELKYKIECLEIKIDDLEGKTDTYKN